MPAPDVFAAAIASLMSSTVHSLQAAPRTRKSDSVSSRAQHGTAQQGALRQRYLEMMRAVWAKHTKPYDVMHSTEWSQFRKFALWSIIA
jgi:hypothetical protein